ncbi:Adhesion G-protein coupled receptor G4 [Liparis tanakae]|uniref:Adhesion G-protein coupled receptor G4 n=1 Tax=Liparis tanakae TaxID=230148 RepID=A0A4Z2JED8_9TELE|nr:Adhesion G-protein coupled receptor G4 [Liparis tanakae]
MICLLNILHVFVTVSLLSRPTATQHGPRLSLWGEAADFTFLGCSQWKLRPQVSIPALQELTLCFSMKFEVLMMTCPSNSHKDGTVMNHASYFIHPIQTTNNSKPWTAFMYTHPEGRCTELGLGGKRGRLVVWLFGTEWTTTQRVDLRPAQWYSVCLTWAHTKDRPALYVDGSLVDITAGGSNTTPAATPPRCQLAPNGTLTLGASRRLGNGTAIPHPAGVGKLSLFRLWDRERSKQEVTSLNCSEGDLVKWERNYWDSHTCAPLPDPGLQCEWPFYEVTLMFNIIRSDGNDTEIYTARDIAHEWLRAVLHHSIYLNRVSVFEVTRSREEDRLVKASHEDRLEHRTIKRFDCLVHVNVIPRVDVAHVQKEMCMNLSNIYDHTSGRFQLLADAESIRITSVESFSDVTVSPTDEVGVATTAFKTTASITSTSSVTSASTDAALATTMTTNPANISELFFEVKLNSSLPDDVMVVLDLQLLPKARRESCVFQVRVTTSLSDTQEMEEQIRDRLLTPYDNGSISIATEDIEIRRILILECNASTQHTRKGLFEWQDTSGGKNSTQPCPKNPQRSATRLCKLCLSTHWMAAHLEDCLLVVETIPDLDHVQVTAGNAEDVVDMIEGLLGNHSTLNYQELLTVLSKLQDVVNQSQLTLNLSQALIDAISDILESDSDLLPFTNMILNITDAVGDTMMGFHHGSFTLVSSAIALSVVDVDPGQFSSLTFGVSSDRVGTKPEIFINKFPFNGTVAFISLPSALQHSFPQGNRSTPRVKFQFFGIPMLFQSSQKGQQRLNTFVVSASVTNASSPIKDLDEDVKVTLHHLTPNTVGCTLLSKHGYLLKELRDVSRTQLDAANEQILTIITYVGCGVSSVFLGITVLTYTAFE